MALSRRALLARGLGCVIGASFASSCSSGSESAPRTISLGPVSDFRQRVQALPLLRVLIYRTEEPQMLAFACLSMVCPHQGCIVRRSTDGFECPCHAAQFSASGALLRGPARRGLPWLQLGLNADGDLLLYPEQEVPHTWSLKVEHSSF